MKAVNPIVIETELGYKAQLTINQSVDGSIVVKAAAYFGKVLTPSIPLKSFTGKNATTRAANYVSRLRSALLDEALDEDANYDVVVGE